MPSLDDLIAEVKAEKPGLGSDTASLKKQFAGPQETAGEAVRSDVQGLASLDPTNPSNMGRLASTALPMALQMLLTKGGSMTSMPRLGAMGGSGLASLLTYLGQAGRGATPEGALGNTGLGIFTEGAVQAGGAGVRQVTGKTSMLREGEEAAVQAEAKLRAARTEAELGQTAKRADVSRAAELKAKEASDAYDRLRLGAEQDQIAKRADVARDQAARRADVATKAGEEASQARAAAEAKVQTRQALVDQQILKHKADALASLTPEEVERKVREGLGAPAPLQAPTIEQLTERATPVRESVQRNVRSVFTGISQKFEQTLTPYYDLPVQGNFSAAVDSERAILESNKEVVGKKLGGIMDDLGHLDPNAALNLDQLPPNIKREYELLKRSGKFTPEQLDSHIKKIAAGLQGPQSQQAAGAFKPPDVRRIDEIRKKLTGVVTGEGSPVERRVANRLIQNIDQNLEGVLPENIRADWTNLRREWHEANAAFSPRFKSMLFNTSTPGEVADVLYGAAKGKKADRVLTVIGKTPKDEIPLLRSAFAERLTQGDVVKNVEGMDKRVFKALFNGTGFEDPKVWTDTLAKGIDLSTVANTPALYARWNARFQEGLKSFGMKKYQSALDRAESQLKSTPDPGTAITEALKGELTPEEALRGELTPEQAADEAMRGKVRPDVSKAGAEAVAGEMTAPQAGDVATAGMERPAEARLRGEEAGMKTPLVGRKMQTYIEHHTAFKVALAMTALGAAGGHFGHPMAGALIPLLYIGSSKGAAAALSNPTFGKIWYNMLKSPNYETAGFWTGRLAAAMLSEGVRESSGEERP